MWVPFRPVRDRRMLINLAEKLLKIKPVRIEKVDGGWKLSIKLKNNKAAEGGEFDELGQLGRAGARI